MSTGLTTRLIHYPNISQQIDYLRQNKPAKTISLVGIIVT